MHAQRRFARFSFKLKLVLIVRHITPVIASCSFKNLH